MGLSTDWELDEWVWYWSVNEAWARGQIIGITYSHDGGELELRGQDGCGSWPMAAAVCYREKPSEVDLEC
jgi:hypothetical protein